MPATTFSTPVKRSRTLGALASTLVASAAIVGFAPAAHAQGQELPSVTVTRAPTSEAVTVRGKAALLRLGVSFVTVPAVAGRQA